MSREDVSARCNSIEECYEFMLAYAGQGLTGREGSASSTEVREYLSRAVAAITGLAESLAKTVREENPRVVDRWMEFQIVLENDARASLASIQLVLAQPVISSQLIDNLNASIHLRALLTDLFLVDEIFKPQQAAANPQS
jgi:hypothetical protein